MCSGDFASGGQYCLGFGGASVDKRFSEEILKALSPHGLKASLAAIEQLSHQGSDQRAVLQRQIQQAEHEAQRAFDQYNQVDPTHRLVAEVLEQRWNDKLEILQRLKDELNAQRDTSASLSPAETDAILALGHDFATAWDDPACPIALKKKIARTLIKEIVVDLDEAEQTLQMIIHWHGGCHIILTLPKPQSGAVVHNTALEELELITKRRVVIVTTRSPGCSASWDDVPVRVTVGVSHAWPTCARSMQSIRPIKQHATTAS